jgi:DGQHR domain-containing protein
MSAIKNKYISRKALQITQCNSGVKIYLLTLTADELLEIAGISRIGRSDDGKIIGYQRPEVKKHVNEIAEYLGSKDMLLAHPIILSFSSQVEFVSSRGPKTSDGLAVAGNLRIPRITSNNQKPAWIVDGQQRVLAMTQCADRSFCVPICAFVTDSVDLQRDQFLRINNTKPLPRGLVAELLPEVSSPLPPKLAVRKIPSTLCNLLNEEISSPFYRLIRRPSRYGIDEIGAVLTDTVIIKMIEESLVNPSGCLFPFRNISSGEYDQTAIWDIIITFWTAVKIVFPDAWGKPPTESRLMHSVGIRSMGKLMDRIMGTVSANHTEETINYVTRELSKLAQHCRWTSGVWEGIGGMQWNEVQSVHKHYSLLSNHIIRLYLENRSTMNIQK